MKTVLASDTGGRLEVSLRDFAIDHSGAVTGVVRLGELDRAGKYEGTLSVDPDDPKAAAITLTANVQDFFIWPLAAVLIGEGLAFGVAYRRDQRGAREILEAELKKAKQEFDDALLTGELTERERSWFDGVLEPPGTSRAAVTLAQIRKAPEQGGPQFAG